MKLKLPTKYFLFLASITLLFCLAIGFDLTPLLRGPAPYPPEWQWSYLFVNTLSRIWLPISVLIILFGFFWIVETKTKRFLVLLIILSFILQMSLLFFSRSGIPVLIHRIINPDLNSYFTASLSIQNPIDFLKNYEQEMKQFVYHARSHPPGAILIFYYMKQLVALFPSFVDFVNHTSPSHGDVRQIWNTLLPINKATAVFAAFFIPFLSTLALVPLFYVGKILYGSKTAIRSAFLYTLLPSILFFIPINDAFLPLFSIGAFFLLLKGLQKNNHVLFMLSGLVLFLGTTFNLALLPFLLLFFIFSLLYLRKNKLAVKKYIKGAMSFSLGFFIPPTLLFLFLDFNSLRLIQIIFAEVPHVHSRSYTTWLFYNVYDFFVFAGIPIALIFLTQIYTSLRGGTTKQSIMRLPRSLWSLAMTTKLDLLFISFLITFILIDISGSTRGETGRIWAPYLPFFILPALFFVTDKIKFTTKLFIGLLILLSVQILFMQEFWVMLW